MIKYIKLFLVFIVGVLTGTVIYGIVEMIVIWVLLNWLRDLFLEIPWQVWVQIDLISLVLIEILIIVGTFLLYKKYEK